jgi:threonine dehydrogenase-like Zn-dependent dehydrogenase
MTDEQLRNTIRDVLARRLRQPAPPEPAAPPPAETAGDHPSHFVYVSLVNTGERCVIEPGVACNHCNYCRSHGH